MPRLYLLFPEQLEDKKAPRAPRPHLLGDLIHTQTYTVCLNWINRTGTSPCVDPAIPTLEQFKLHLGAVFLLRGGIYTRCLIAGAETGDRERVHIAPASLNRVKSGLRVEQL